MVPGEILRPTDGRLLAARTVSVPARQRDAHVQRFGVVRKRTPRQRQVFENRGEAGRNEAKVAFDAIAFRPSSYQRLRCPDQRLAVGRTAQTWHKGGGVLMPGTILLKTAKAARHR
jgi:hypothetical protein